MRAWFESCWAHNKRPGGRAPAVEYTEEGSQFEIGKINGSMKCISAIVTAFPFYEREKKRVREDLH